jgi:hypothetical protein
MEIKGLKESLGLTDDQFKYLAELRVRTEMQTALMMVNVMRRGGNIHGVDQKATEKRRAANKRAHKQRVRNR